jgi:hypothetical protein
VPILILDSEEEDIANNSKNEKEDNLKGGLLFVEIEELEKSSS